MKLFTIRNIANFMTALLSDRENVFDQFLLNDAVIVTGNTYTIDGHINPDFYSADDLNELRQEARDSGRIFSEDMIRWEKVKHFCFDCIRGTRLPLSFKISLCLAPESITRFIAGIDSSISPDQINSLNINIKYDGSTLTCTTALSLKIFTLDKTVEHAWDEMFERFLNANNFDHD